MKKCCVIGLLLLLAGCKSQNSYSTYGSDILLYRGDTEVLENCCNVAISLMADDLKAEKKLDAAPDVKMSMTGFTNESRQMLSSHRKISNRYIMAMRVDEQDYRIEIIRIDDHPATVILCHPSGDERLVNHLSERFSNSHVKPVDAL